MTTLFEEVTHQEILEIPVTRVEEEDKVAWKVNKSHDFSVKGSFGYS